MRFQFNFIVKCFLVLYSQKLLLNMLDNHCIHINEAITEEERDEHKAHHDQPISSYDFVYLPMDFK